MLMILFLVPLLDLATIGLRAMSVCAATRDAALAAGRAQTFQKDLEPETGKLSAKNTARRQIERNLANCLGPVHIDRIAVSLVATPLGEGEAVTQESPIAEPDAQSHVYQIEVTTSGHVQPLLLLSKDLFGDVPGLTTVFPVTFTSREFAEHVAGLSR